MQKRQNLSTPARPVRRGLMGFPSTPVENPAEKWSAELGSDLDSPCTAYLHIPFCRTITHSSSSGKSGTGDRASAEPSTPSTSAEAPPESSPPTTSAAFSPHSAPPSPWRTMRKSHGKPASKISTTHISTPRSKTESTASPPAFRLFIRDSAALSDAPRQKRSFSKLSSGR